MGADGKQIYQWLVEQKTGIEGLAGPQAEVQKLIQQYNQLGDDATKSIAKFESFWHGPSAGAAQRGAGPFGVEMHAAAPNLDAAQNYLKNQVTSFNKASTQVVPVPDAPNPDTEPGGWTKIKSFFGSDSAENAIKDYQSKSDSHNAANQKNIDTYKWFSTDSDANANGMPKTYGPTQEMHASFAADPSLAGSSGHQASTAPPSPGGGGGGGTSGGGGSAAPGFSGGGYSGHAGGGGGGYRSPGSSRGVPTGLPRTYPSGAGSGTRFPNHGNPGQTDPSQVNAPMGGPGSGNPAYGRNGAGGYGPATGMPMTGGGAFGGAGGFGADGTRSPGGRFGGSSSVVGRGGRFGASGSGTGGGRFGGGAGGAAGAEESAGRGPRSGAFGGAAAEEGAAGRAGAAGTGGRAGSSGMPMGGARGAKGGEDDEHSSASYLVSEDNGNEIVGELPLTAPPVIGE